MFSQDSFNPFVKEIVSRLSGQDSGKNAKSMNNSTNSNGNNNSGISITPSQALVIAGIIGGVLEITSILVDKDQLVQIVVTGSLKRKTELDKMLDQIGQMPFEKVFKAIMNNLT